MRSLQALWVVPVALPGGAAFHGCYHDCGSVTGGASMDRVCVRVALLKRPSLVGAGGSRTASVCLTSVFLCCRTMLSNK